MQLPFDPPASSVFHGWQFRQSLDTDGSMMQVSSGDTVPLRELVSAANDL